MYFIVPQRRSPSGVNYLCGAMGSNGATTNPVTGAMMQASPFTNVVRVALAISAIVIVLTVIKNRSMITENMMAPWADIGPLFAASLALGPAFGLTHYL